MWPELVPFCRQIVTVEARSSVDGYGEPTYSTAVSHRARVVGKRRLVRNSQGDEVMSTHQVYFAGQPAIGAHDRLTLSTGDVNSTETGARQPPVLATGIFPDDAGRKQVTVYL